MNNNSKTKNLKKLNQIIKIQSCLAQADFNLNEFMNLIVKEMQKLTPATGVVIELVEGHEMVYRAANGTVSSHVGLRLPMEKSISGLCIKTGEILSSKDTEKDDRVNKEACRRIGARSLVVAPLYHEGKAIGVLKILSHSPSAFNNEDTQTVQLMAGFIGSALAHQMLYEKNQKFLIERTQALFELQQAQKRLQHLAHYDYLTDLPNRTLFTDKFKTAIQNAELNNQLYALIYLDIDHFKRINDDLGHAIGDELLKAFAVRLKQCVRSYDTVARIGGDEFILILKIENPHNAIITGEKIIERMRQAFTFHDQVLNITTSVGITYFQGSQTNPADLIKQADQALYYAKSSGRNNYKIFEKMGAS